MTPNCGQTFCRNPFLQSDFWNRPELGRQSRATAPCYPDGTEWFALRLDTHEAVAASLGPKWIDCTAPQMHTHTPAACPAARMSRACPAARMSRAGGAGRGHPFFGIRCQAPPRLPRAERVAKRRHGCQRGTSRCRSARCWVLPSSAACCQTVPIWAKRTSAPRLCHRRLPMRTAASAPVRSHGSAERLHPDCPIRLKIWLP